MAREKTIDVEAIERPPSSPSPLIFISHDTRDAEIARLFSDLINKASAGLLFSFYSTDQTGTQGIEYGTEFYNEVMDKLRSASAVVCLLTQRSVERPWILYEAGVAKGKSETPVIGVALGIPLSQASTGPFAQFQNCADEVDSLTQLVMQMVTSLTNAVPNREVVKSLVQVFNETASPILKELNREAAEKENRSKDFKDFLELGMYKLRKELKDQHLHELLAGSKEIQVLKTWFPETNQIATGLKQAIRNRATVRLLLCKPESTILRQRSEGAGKNWLWGSIMIYLGIEDIYEAVRATPGVNVQIRFYDAWPGCPVIWYDEKILMGFYFRGEASPNWPWVSVEKGKFFAKILNEQFKSLWDNADERLDGPDDMKDWLNRNKLEFRRP